MFGGLKGFLERHVVTDVSDEISACMECGAVQCVESKWRNCRFRLDRVAALKVLRESAPAEKPASS